MIEIWVVNAGVEIFRERLNPGRYSFGRTQDNDISVQNPSVSRHHLQIDVTEYDTRIQDLGSTNGTALDSLSLTAHQEVIWSEGQDVTIGPLTVRMRRVGVQTNAQKEAMGAQVDYEFTPQAPGKSEVATIICAQADPHMTTLSGPSIYIGQHSTCAIRLNLPGVATHHCILQLQNGYVSATNLDMNRPARLDGTPMPIGQPQEWREHQVLQISSATLHLSFDPLGRFAEAAAASSGRQKPKEQSGLWRYALILIALIGFIVVCLGVTLVVAGNMTGCGSPNPQCIIASFGSGSTGDNSGGVSAAATPTLASHSAQGAASGRDQVISFATETPVASATPEECVPVVQTSGWLELPFPYQGIDASSRSSPEQFRRISQRSRFGGRINSFFDHEFPVYPPAVGGREPEDKIGTLVTFNGGRSIDGFAQDSEGADWYSGHPGIDFSPAHPREATTPVLAAAEGKLVTAKVDNDGNHLVILAHDPDGDGFYDYATYYFHLHPDEFFEAMLAMEEGAPIAARQRIGTMGTTGRSTGIHLHFEVRKDVNRDGLFTLFERVDPYGFFPTEDIPTDPWSVEVAWTDSKGNLIEHDGIISEYLWVHSLVEIEGELGEGECAEVSPVQIDLNLYPVLGYAVVNPGFTYIVRNEQGDVLREGDPQLRRITILPEHLEGVDIDTVSLEYLDPELDVWFSVSEGKSMEENQFGGYTFSAKIRKTGRYVLVGREVVDNVAPITTILLNGERIGGDPFTFADSVQITLDPSDRGLITSDIISTQYSLDCGQTYIDYAGPFTVTLETPHTCGEEGSGSQGVDFGEGEFLLLAFSEDSENNFEQPPSQVRFSIQ